MVLRQACQESISVLDACCPALTFLPPCTRSTVLLGTPAAAVVGRPPAGDPHETFFASGCGLGVVSRFRLVVRDQRAPRYRSGDAQPEPPAPAPIHRERGRYSE